MAEQERSEEIIMDTREELLCYCFTHSRKDIEADFKKNGRSTILEAIMAASRAGECRCQETNPKGR